MDRARAFGRFEHKNDMDLQANGAKTIYARPWPAATGHKPGRNSIAIPKKADTKTGLSPDYAAGGSIQTAKAS